jgi:hypothetical protein
LLAFPSPLQFSSPLHGIANHKSSRTTEKNVKETHFYLHQIQEKSSHKYLHSFANHFFQIRSHLEKKKSILPNYNQRKNKNKEMEIE